MNQEYKVFGYRWINLLVFTLVTFMAGIGFLAVAPLLEGMAQHWSTSFAAVSLLISVFGLAQMLLSIPVGWASGKTGFKPPVAVGASLLALGFVLRGTTDAYGPFLLYTLIAAAGWGLVFAPVGSLAATWFPGREIGLANSLWTVGFLAGQAFGTLTAIPFLSSMGWPATWRTYAAIAVVIALLAWLLLRPRPAVPPEPRPHAAPSGIRAGIAETMNRTNGALQYTVFASVGSLAVAPAIVPPMLIGKGVPPPLAGVIAGLALVGSMLGSLLGPPLAFGRRRSRATMLVCAVLAPVLFMAIFYAPVTGGNALPTALLSFLFGFVMAPIMGISMGVGQMQPGVHPGNAGILAGVFLTSIGLGAALFPVIVGQIVDIWGILAGAWMLAALAAVSVAVIAFFVPEPEPPDGPPPGH